MSVLFATFWPYLAAAGAAILALFGAWFKGKASAEKVAEQKLASQKSEHESQLAQVQVAQAVAAQKAAEAASDASRERIVVDAQVLTLSSGEAEKELQNAWVRD